MCCFGLFARVSDGSRAALSSSRPSSSRGGAASRFAWSAMLLRSTADSFSPWLLHHRPGEPFTRLPDSPQLGDRAALDGADRRLRLWRRRGLERALRRGDVDAERLRRDDQVALALAEQVEAVAAQDHELEQQTAQFRLALFRQGLLSSSRPFCPGAQARADRDAAVPGPLFLPARRPGARPARSADEEKLPADKNDQ